MFRRRLSIIQELKRNATEQICAVQPEILGIVVYHLEETFVILHQQNGDHTKHLWYLVLDTLYSTT